MLCRCFVCGEDVYVGQRGGKPVKPDLVCTGCKPAYEHLLAAYPPTERYAKLRELREAKQGKQVKKEVLNQKYITSTCDEAKVRGHRDNSCWDNPCESDILRKTRDFYKLLKR